MPNSLVKLSGDSESISFNLDTTKISYQDGPNCFNAVLYAKGYLAEHTKTDESEFAFFLEKFCRKKIGPEAKGDVIALRAENSFYHAALAMGDGKIFEKLSTWGRNPPQIMPLEKPQEMLEERKISSQYLIKKKTESKYFNGEDTTAGMQVIYQCQEIKEARNELIRLSLIPGVQQIQNLNREIENVIFQKKPPVGCNPCVLRGLTV